MSEWLFIEPFSSFYLQLTICQKIPIKELNCIQRFIVVPAVIMFPNNVERFSVLYFLLFVPSPFSLLCSS